jgi:ribosomal protein S8
MLKNNCNKITIVTKRLNLYPLISYLNQILMNKLSEARTHTYSQLNVAFINCLFNTGVLAGFNIDISDDNKEKNKLITIHISRNINYGPIIKKIKIISKPARRIFISIKMLRVLHRRDFNAVFILHTTKGILSIREALSVGVGGELICKIIY